MGGTARVVDLPKIKIADHELIRRISAGSYGEVWLARNHLGTYRAVKIVQQARFDHARPFEREYEGMEKYEPVSRLHEGLVDVLQVGRADPGTFYYVMELADDVSTGPTVDPIFYEPRTLASDLKAKGRLPVSDCIQIGIRLCQTLTCLHERGLIHRDIKPSNVIFINHEVKLADIGLVADLRGAKTYVGTAGFIPPEGPNSVKADIYGLGKLLYEVSTGNDRNDFPALPDRTVYSAEFLELNSVLLRACSPDPVKRYRSAEAMEADLRLIAVGKSVRRLHQLEARFTRIWRWSAVVAAALALLAFGYSERTQTFQRAREENARAVGNKIGQGTSLLRQGNFMASLPVFVEAWQLDANNAAADETYRLRIGSILAACPRLERRWMLTNGPIRSCSLHDGWALAAVVNDHCRVFDISSGKQVSGNLEEGLQPQRAGFTPEGHVIVANWQNTARLLDWRTGEALLTLPHARPVFSASASPDGKRFITGCRDGNAYLWDQSGQLSSTLTGHTGAVYCVKVSKSGNWAVTGSQDHTARVWDLRGSNVSRVIQHRDYVYSADFSPDERLVATSSFDGEVKLWDLSTEREVEPPLRHDGGLFTVQFSGEGDRILTAGLDGTVRLWNKRTHQLIDSNHTIRHATKLLDACFDDSGDRILTAGHDGALTLWNLRSPQAGPIPLGKVQKRPVESSLISPNGEWELLPGSPMLVAHRPGGKRWPLKELKAIDGLIRFGHKGNSFFTIDGHDVHLVNLRLKRVLILNHPNPVTHAEFSPDDSKLVCASTDKSLEASSAQLWDAMTGAPIGGPLRHQDGVLHASFSSDGQWVATASEDSTAIVWDAKTGKAKTPKLEHWDKVRYASFARSHPWIVTASDDRTALIWDAATGDPLTPPFTHENRVVRAEFSDDDAALLTVDDQNMQWKWPIHVENRDLKTVKEVALQIAGLTTSE